MNRIVFSALLFLFLNALVMNSVAFANDSNMKFYFFGIDLKWIKEAKPKDFLLMGAGAAAGFFIHEGAHAGYLEFINADYSVHINPLHGGIEIFYTDLTQSQQVTFSRIGFAVQSLIGLGLTSFEKTRHLSFTRGWIGGEALQLGRYATHLNDYGDFAEVTKNGINGAVDFGIHTIVTTHNILRQKW